MADVIKLVQADTLPQIKLTLTDDVTNLPINLSATGTTVTLHVRPVNTSILSFSRAATITDAANGIAIVEWGPTDLAIAAGMYEAEVEVYIPSLGRETIYDMLSLQIREDIA